MCDKTLCYKHGEIQQWAGYIGKAKAVISTTELWSKVPNRLTPIIF